MAALSVVAPEVWVQLVAASGHRCECTGECGHHVGRCTAAGAYRAFVVAPVPGRDRSCLVVWCPGCWAAAQSVAGAASFGPVPVQRPGGDR
jgi:hypothetical protein